MSLSNYKTLENGVVYFIDEVFECCKCNYYYVNEEKRNSDVEPMCPDCYEFDIVKEEANAN